MTLSSLSCSDEEDGMSPSPSASSGRPLSPPVSWEEYQLKSVLDATGRRLSGHSGVSVASRDVDPKLRFILAQLEKDLERLKHHAQRPPDDRLKAYASQLHFLQRTLDQISPPKTEDVTLGFDVPALGLSKDTRLTRAHGRNIWLEDRRKMTAESASAPLLKPLKPPYQPPAKADREAAVSSAEIFHKTAQRSLLGDREELLGASDSELRRRKVEVTGDGEIDDLLKAHHEAQEQVAEEMLSLTRSLKEQTEAAGQVIRKDISTLERTRDTAEKNQDKLSIESERLAKHTQTLCRWWIWLIMVTVTITFIAMVMIMKVFRKRW